MTKREQLYYLLKEVNNKKYDIATFCDEFMTTLYYESNGISELNVAEQNIFETLAKVVERYSKYEIDHKLYPKVYTNDSDVKKAVEVACSKLGIF